jgi:hypothetical protein
VTDLRGVFTYHNDAANTGANTREYALTTANVNTSNFGKLFSCAVDGAIYAQPLWVAGAVVNGAKRNVLIVATEHDSAYAFDADASPCVLLWHANLIDAAHGATAGETPMPMQGDIQPEIGVTGTPVIDPATDIIYMVSKSVDTAGNFVQRLHALDIKTGSEALNSNRPTVISASIAGDGDGSSAGTLQFDPKMENQRSALTLVNGVVYAAWAAHGDIDPFHGWLIGYSAATLGQVPGAAFNTTPNAVAGFNYSRGGIWMSGGAPAADAYGDLYLITGNGVYDGISDFGDSVLRLSTVGGLAVQDWFTPEDQSLLDAHDRDLGSGGAVMLVDLSPSSTAPHLHLLIGGGKEGSGNLGEIYVLNRDEMGHFTNNNAGVLQEFPLGANIFSTAAFWQSRLYVAGAEGPLVAFTLDPATGLFNATSLMQSTAIYGGLGATPAVSSSGAANGIVWLIDSGAYCTAQALACGPAVLHAYDATNLSNELWNSTQGTGNAAGNAVKFSVPTIANGKVYIGTRGNNTGGATSSMPGEVDVYGLLGN